MESWRGEPLDTSRQPDPAEPAPSPEDGAETDARGTAAPAIDIGVDRGGRRVAAFLTFAGTVMTVLALGILYADPSPVSLALAVLLTAVTLAAGKSWTGGPELRATIVGSRLEVTRGRSRHVFDLASPTLSVDVVGVPDERGWRVLFHRRGMAPYVLDADAVDAAELTRALHRSRREVRYLPRGES